MSHFAVLVVGDDVESQLQPYHEFECTGLNDRWVQDVDITDEVRDMMEKYKEQNVDDPMPDALGDALGYWGLDDRIVSSEDEVDIADAHKFGYAIVQGDQLIRAVNRTNPNRKWDWYSIGGRWSGFFKLKPGAWGMVGRLGLGARELGEGEADQTRKGNVDWEGMRSEAGNEAGLLWDRVRQIAPQGWESWPSVTQRFGADLEGARQWYHNQEGKRQLRDKNSELYWSVDDDVLVDRDTYVQRARNNAILTYAVVKDGQWYQRGEMGWWGTSSNEMDRDEWAQMVGKLLDELPDDTLLTLVDCHI